ncbi:hypothetical protein F4861DRAFT_358689 [Xylaria intraflava]|nr:hypothetical protein F4861DRAFT_358689 [Xylaria intraflava]
MANYVTQRAAGREHIPLYPKGFVVARIIQLLIGVACLGLSAYAVAIVAISGADLTLFTAIVTLISSIYLLVAHFGNPAAYNYWAILGLDIFLVIFWLISFALLASQAASLLSIASYDYFDPYYSFANDALGIYGVICAAAAGLGAVLWLIYLITLIIHSIALHRHRRAGLPAMAGASAGAPGIAEVQGADPKIQMQPQPPQAYYPPQPIVQNHPNY